jgi:hypothetical protein
VRPSATPTPTVLPSVAPTPTASVTPTPTPTLVQPVNQQPLVINSKLLIGSSTGFTAAHLEVFVLSTSGGSGTGSVIYRLDSGSYCILDREGGRLSTSRPTTCMVTAIKAASSGFNAVLSTSTQFVFTTRTHLSPPVVSYEVTGGTKAESMAIGEVVFLQGDYLTNVAKLTYSVTGENCTVRLGYVLTATTKATCIVTATRPAYETQTMTSVGTGVLRNVTNYYGQITSAPVSFVFDYRDQAPLFIYNPVTTTTAPFVYLISMGGSGTGATTFSVSGESCSISGTGSNTMLNATAPATCVVTATKSASPIGYRSAVNSLPKTFYFTKP